jgi:DNA-binding FadR family transcriptional regulator
MDETVDLHDDIVRAIASRNPLRARQAMEAHVEAARDRMLKQLGSRIR